MIHQENYYYLGTKALILNDDGELLLLKKERRSGEIFWDIPGGRIEKGETELEALQRELEEEIGLSSVPEPSKLNMHLTGVRMPNADRDVGLILSLYQLQVPSDYIVELSDEHVDFKWFCLSEAIELLQPQYPKSLIDDVKLVVKLKA